MIIALTGDWHLDGTVEQYKAVKMDVEGMPKTLILMGDMIDTGISGGMNWNQENITVQLQQFYDIIKNKKILGYVLGNHEYRVWRLLGLNFYNTGTENDLGAQTNMYRFKSGAVVVVEHGSRTPANQTKQVQDLADKYPGASICALGHTHGLVIERNWNEQYLVRTGHLQLYPRYAEDKIMKPKARGYIRYDTNKNRVSLEVLPSYSRSTKLCYTEN